MKRKKWIVWSIIIVIVAGLIAGGFIMEKKKEREEQKKQEEYALRMAYLKQNEALNYYLNTDNYLPPRWEADNPFYGMYFSLAYYKKTGKELALAQIHDYLSQEFEDNGEIRIYTNGRHPEIADYVEWYIENKDA